VGIGTNDEDIPISMAPESLFISVEYCPERTITTEYVDGWVNSTTHQQAYPRTIDGRSTHLYVISGSIGQSERSDNEDYQFAYALDSHTRVYVRSTIPWMEGSCSLVDTLHVERRKVDSSGARRVNMTLGPYRASCSVPVDLVASIYKPPWQR